MARVPPELVEQEGGRDGKVDREVVVQLASEITPEPVRFLWDERFPLGALSLLAGEGGLGKSTLLTDLHARLSVGRLAGEFAGRTEASLIITSEDHARSVVVPRLIVAGADLERVGIVGVRVNGIGDLVTLPDDLPAIEAQIERTGARLLTIDPVVAAISGAVDSHKDHSIRRVLGPLALLAERREVAIAGTIHMNKSAVSDLLNRVSGSKGFVNAARSVLVFDRDPDDPDGEEGYRRVIVHAKTNWGALAPALAARIEVRELLPEETGAEATITTTRLVVTGESKVTKADLTSATSEGSDKRELARHWLLQLARDTWHDGGELKVAAEEAGHRTRTLQRAFGELVAEGAGEVKEEGFPRRTYWLIRSRAKGSGATDGPTGGATRQIRVLEPSPGDSDLQSRQRPRLAPLGPTETCECRHPARSPRATASTSAGPASARSRGRHEGRRPPARLRLRCRRERQRRPPRADS
jgi:AAA domain